MERPSLPIVIAHRGGRKWAPENTMAAFRMSLAAGVNGIELDIHRCNTGELVVIHDEDVERTTGGAGLIKDMTYSEISRLSAGLWFGPQFAGERIPLLEEVLDLVDGQIMLNIEIKNTPIKYDGIEDDLIKLLNQYRHKEKLIISSFDHQILSCIHAQAPSYCLAVLAEAIFVDIGQYAREVGAKFWHPAFDCLRADVLSAAHKAGLRVNAWTMNSTDQWSQGLTMGLDGIVTDDPKGLLTFLDAVHITKS